MKKSLLAIVLALFVLNSCTPSLDVPDINKDNIYYGLVMNKAILTHKGLAHVDDTESSYVLRLSTLDVNDAGNYAATRILSLDLQFNLKNGKIPEGVYSFSNLKLTEGAFNNILSGSTFINMESGDYKTYAMWLIDEGKINIQHGEGDNYIMDVEFSAKKLNKEAGVTVGKAKPIVCRYEGELEKIGLDESYEFKSYQPYYAYAFYYPLLDGQTYWDLTIVDRNYHSVFIKGDATGNTGTYSAYRSQYQVICDSNGMLLPQGRFDLDPYGNLVSQTLMGAATQKLDLTESISLDEDGEEIISIRQEATSFVDMMTDGYVQLKSRGQGRYDIVVETFGEFDGYKYTLSNSEIEIIPGYTGADRKDVDFKFTQSMMLYMGRYQYSNGTLSVPYWYLFLYDKSRGEFVQLGVNVEIGNNYASGIPTGKYVVSSSSDALTVDMGYEDQNRDLYGSMVTDGDTEVYDLVTSGVLEVTKNSNGTYKFVLDMVGNNKNYIKGSWEGTPELYDNTSSSSSGSVGSGQSAFKVSGTKSMSNLSFEGCTPGSNRLLYNTLGFFGNYATFMK